MKLNFQEEHQSQFYTISYFLFPTFLCVKVEYTRLVFFIRIGVSVRKDKNDKKFGYQNFVFNQTVALKKNVP